MNKNIIDNLNNLYLQSKNDPTKNKFQISAIKKSIYAIKQYPNEINSKEEALKIKGVGEKIACRIEEIISTGNLKELNNEINELLNITGIGPQKAKKLNKIGIFTYNDLKKSYNESEIELTEDIIIGIKYYEDFNKRIPRTEVDKFKIIFDKVFSELKLIYNICGSYRRGKIDCGDIDILVTSNKSQSNLMKKILIGLEEILVKDAMLTPNAKKKFMGACKLKNGLVRRLDIRIIDYKSYYTALMYFTGSMEYNIKMRNIAIEKGYLLNEYGLFKDKIPMEINSEKDICEILGVDYCSALHR